MRRPRGRGPAFAPGKQIGLASLGLLLAFCLLALSACADTAAVEVSSTATTAGEALDLWVSPGATPVPVADTVQPAPVEITIAAVGDVMGEQTVRWCTWDGETGTYDFWPIFAPVAPYLQAADYAVLNLETRFADPEPDGGYIGFQRLNSPPALGEALIRAGVDLAGTANNHSLDMGWRGVVETVDTLDDLGLEHMGNYRSAEDRRSRSPLIVDVEGVKVAFLNYTISDNGLYLAPEHRGYAVNFMDGDDVTAEAGAAREAGADVVVLMVHWGKEGWRRPDGIQHKIVYGAEDYDSFFCRGVDVILGAHPHVVQAIARVTRESGEGDGYVAFSLGNFLSGDRHRYKDSGIIAYVHIRKDGDTTAVTGVSYLPVYVQKKVVGSGTEFRILPVLPGIERGGDLSLSAREQARMDQVWQELDELLYEPDDNIVPLDPSRLALPAGSVTADSHSTGG